MTITLDGETLFEPVTWNESYSVVESTSTSEAGTDLVNVTRSDKLQVSASFQCSSLWYHKFHTMSVKPQLVLTKYDSLTNTTSNRTVRMRDFSGELQRYSKDIPGSNGYYNVGFTLIEF